MSQSDHSLDFDRPNAARIYDYALGGNHNFQVDRDLADQMWAVSDYDIPTLPYRLNRSFLGRAVRFLLAQGIDQFLDLGSGIPTVGNVHEIAQTSNPHSRVLYVDSDPVAVAHSRQLLAENHAAAVVNADVRDVSAVLDAPETHRLLDFDRPIGLLMVAVLHFIPDESEPRRMVDGYLRQLMAGSYLALSHFTHDGQPEQKSSSGKQWYQRTSTPVTTRSAAELAELLRGTELVEPGIVWTPRWRPDLSEPAPDPIADSAIYAAVGRVPVAEMTDAVSTDSHAR